MMSKPDTSNPMSAREHARSMAGAEAETMPTVPPSAVRDLPEGVEPSEVIWDETIGGGGYVSCVLPRGARLRLTDIDGDACLSMLLYNADRPIERLNVADTVKVQWNGYLAAGRLLLSDMGRVLMTLTADTCGTHDCFAGPSTRHTNAAKYGEGANHSPTPSARDRFLIAVAKHGLSRKDVMPCINLFKGVRIEDGGAMTFLDNPPRPGQHVELRAEMNVIVVLANTPHVLDPRPAYTVTKARATAWRGPVTPGDDPLRGATPEGRRAFENVELYFAGAAPTPVA